MGEKWSSHLYLTSGKRTLNLANMILLHVSGFDTIAMLHSIVLKMTYFMICVRSSLNSIGRSNKSVVYQKQCIFFVLFCVKVIPVSHRLHRTLYLLEHLPAPCWWWGGVIAMKIFTEKTEGWHPVATCKSVSFPTTSQGSVNFYNCVPHSLCVVYNLICHEDGSYEMHNI